MAAVQDVGPYDLIAIATVVSLEVCTTGFVSDATFTMPRHRYMLDNMRAAGRVIASRIRCKRGFHASFDHVFTVEAGVMRVAASGGVCGKGCRECAEFDDDMAREADMRPALPDSPHRPATSGQAMSDLACHLAGAAGRMDSETRGLLEHGRRMSLPEYDRCRARLAEHVHKRARTGTRL